MRKRICISVCSASTCAPAEKCIFSLITAGIYVCFIAHWKRRRCIKSCYMFACDGEHCFILHTWGLVLITAWWKTEKEKEEEEEECSVGIKRLLLRYPSDISKCIMLMVFQVLNSTLLCSLLIIFCLFSVFFRCLLRFNELKYQKSVVRSRMCVLKSTLSLHWTRVWKPIFARVSRPCPPSR